MGRGRQTLLERGFWLTSEAIWGSSQKQPSGQQALNLPKQKGQMKRGRKEPFRKGVASKLNSFCKLVMLASAY